MTAPSPGRPTESAEQAALFDFLTRIGPRVPAVRWAFHVPNGGHRAKAVAIRLKREGVKAGVPDVWLPVRREPYAGFVCELKVGANRPTAVQRAWLELLTAEGWRAVVCWGWQSAACELLLYLGEVPENFGLELNERNRNDHQNHHHDHARR